MSEPIAPEVFTADYIGEPGERTFFLQARGPRGTSTFLVEKQQVAAVAERVREMLILIDQEDTIRAAVPSRDPALALEGPTDPEWRVGTIALGYEETEDQIVISLEDAEAADDDDDAPVASATFLLRRDQARAFVLHVVAVVDEGRETCQLCGLPMDPAGHLCPASNGHHPAA